MSYLCIILKQPDISLKGVKITISNRNEKQEECIPVGCVPPACFPYLPACTAPGGCTWSQGGTWSGRVYLVPGGVPALGGVYLVPGGVSGSGGCTWSGGVPGLGGCTWSQGVYLPGGV